MLRVPQLHAPRSSVESSPATTPRRWISPACSITPMATSGGPRGCWQLPPLSMDCAGSHGLRITPRQRHEQRARILSPNPSRRGDGDFADATSLYFDLLRFAAATLVVFEHFRLFGFLPAHTWIASFSHEAVIAFFVLSGAVISHAADRPQATLRDFVIARAVRIYSVTLPAILFAYAMALCFYGKNPSTQAPDPGLEGLGVGLYTLFTTVFFLNESWFIWNEAV